VPAFQFTPPEIAASSAAEHQAPVPPLNSHRADFKIKLMLPFRTAKVPALAGDLMRWAIRSSRRCGVRMLYPTTGE